MAAATWDWTSLDCEVGMPIDCITSGWDFNYGVATGWTRALNLFTRRAQRFHEEDEELGEERCSSCDVHISAHPSLRSERDTMNLAGYQLSIEFVLLNV